MRPSILNPLFADAVTLDGIGPRFSVLLKKLFNMPAEGHTPHILNLLWHMPTGVIDRRHQPKIAGAFPGQIATLAVQIMKHKAPHGRSRAPYRIQCEDESGRLDLIFFHGDKRYLTKTLPVGALRYVSGRVERYGDQLQMPHPDYIVDADEFETLPLIEPVYPLTAGLSGKILGKALQQALAKLPKLPEWQDAAWLKKMGWADINASLTALHRPEDEADISPVAPARQRLAYDELLANQLALAIVRSTLKKEAGRALEGDGHIRAKILKTLPFALTASQEETLKEIAADIAAPHRMLRLLQGDVGSGKTVVSLMAMAIAVEAGAQAALMVPTEVLARQHLNTLQPWADQSGLRLALLTGREKGVSRRQILTLLAEGKIDILIGTHALFQHDVEFKDLALAVIDEQHRFGVHQRLALQSKGRGGGANVLVMTATPIPRTLLLTHYGDMDVSKLTEKPAGRKAIKTVAIPHDRLEDVLSAVGRAMGEDAQIYWVCPLVEGSQKIDLAAAEERYAHLKQRFGSAVGLVHGQLKGTEKDTVMAAFAAGELSILVSTTVIEVGVDVSNASVMVIEHAERFGLAQLHQLRGRVGRGEAQSTCLLLYQSNLSETARSRLEIMRQTEDGFLIAEEDLRLRGGGEVLGTRQSGIPEFQLANVPGFEDLLSVARDDAKLILEQDPTFSTARGEALRLLLYLFECDEAIRLFQA